MKQLQIEVWALRIVTQVEAGQRIEDTKVELKATWPNAVKAARRIAGHANAARGEPILWLVGVDQTAGAVGAPREELANWYPQVKAQFDGLAPRLTDLNVPVGDKTITALLFETDRAPFVVKNPAYNQPGGGPVQYEVPWREGTSIRSARREDLVRLLAPLQQVPDFEILEASLEAKQHKAEPLATWKLRVVLFASLSDEHLVVMPFHKSYAELEIPGFVSRTAFEQLVLNPPGRYDRPGQWVDDSATVVSTQHELTMHGSGRVVLTAKVDLPLVENITSDANITLSLLPANAERPAFLELSLTRMIPVPEPHTEKWIWQGNQRRNQGDSCKE